MPAPAAVSIVLGRFGVWRFGTGLLLLLASTALAAWSWAGTAFDVRAFAAAAVACLAIAAAAWSTRTTGPVLLRWDGRQWFVGPGMVPGADSGATDVSVALDLGGWMLLRLRPTSAARWRATVWLPAQQLGHEAHWHAFRCAVYSPRPAPGGLSEADP
jgi:hypothetical protein